jgi:Flp pilus assembly protein CpaB
MIGRFFKNKSLVTLIAAVVCVIIIAFFYNYRVNKIIDTIEIPVAAKRLDAREVLTEENIKKVKVARSLLSANVITNTQQIIGKYVNYNTFVPEGGMFYASAVVDWESMPDSTWSNISEGKTIIYLDIKEGSAYGNSIYPGDRIDLYIRTVYNGKIVYGKFVESIKVLAVKDENGSHIFKKEASAGRPSQLIFEVDEDMFLLLKSAAYLSGDFEIIPIPRNSNYTAKDGETLLNGEFFVQQIKLKSRMLKPDLIPEENVDNDNIEIKD